MLVGGLGTTMLGKGGLLALALALRPVMVMEEWLDTVMELDRKEYGNGNGSAMYLWNPNPNSNPENRFQEACCSLRRLDSARTRCFVAWMGTTRVVVTSSSRLAYSNNAPFQALKQR